jgi:hypothetical protein
MIIQQRDNPIIDEDWMVSFQEWHYPCSSKKNPNGEGRKEKKVVRVKIRSQQKVLWSSFMSSMTHVEQMQTRPASSFRSYDFF